MGSELWITVYQEGAASPIETSTTIYSYLVPVEVVENLIGDPDWDLRPSESLPHFNRGEVDG